MEDEIQEHYFEIGEGLEILICRQATGWPSDMHDIMIITSHPDDDGANVVGALTIALTLDQMVKLADTLQEAITKAESGEE